MSGLTRQKTVKPLEGSARRSPQRGMASVGGNRTPHSVLYFLSQHISPSSPLPLNTTISTTQISTIVSGESIYSGGTNTKPSDKTTNVFLGAGAMSAPAPLPAERLFNLLFNSIFLSPDFLKFLVKLVSIPLLQISNQHTSCRTILHHVFQVPFQLPYHSFSFRNLSNSSYSGTFTVCVHVSQPFAIQKILRYLLSLSMLFQRF
ncbi:hypothetical protein HOY80DRAFT_713558 [Tuber brumale]|nr:hypothetical protein HOY80DRAFT_713558 [Tuber brumale]